MDGPTESLLLTPEEVAAELRIARSRVFELIASGELRSMKIGRSRRVTRQALGAFVQRLVEDQDA
jgi:excisionase family DNA binding protein